ncbi:hypothetical protein RBG61_12700 [Paludicola sp. MB14-C6]|uniref:hypothetical protein n=1 Tax=Paludihabitans sp. MB14-C6 TaxID=3070656 RepID=UPI0027DC0A2D|nr:hypothetical protein [Paludicola sp. MB14-C6]WMJ22836.1 hypothetical protein RBG61_12700 [Paludicola sp. MB14-C6]
MILSQNDISILQELAKEYMQYATLPLQQKKKELWLALNRFEMQRPMIVIDQIPWHEMDVDGFLKNQVNHPYWAMVETALRQSIYKWKYMPADMVLPPYIMLPRLIQNSGYGIMVEEERLASDTANDVVGHKFYNQFEEMEDVEKIVTPTISVNRKGEQEIIEIAETIFKGIAPFKMQGHTVHLGLWDAITQWMGVENCYIELMDRPELMHAIMDKLTNSTIGMIEQMNKEGVFDAYSNVCHCSYTFTDDLPSSSCNLDNPTSKDVWAFGLAQLFSSVSPAITDEFEVPYMQKLFPYFGAIYYGCCDRLDDRLDIITKMPNIRKISCSPWSNREEFARKLQKNYIMSNKPNPALLATDSMSEQEIRADIRRTMKAAKDNNVNLELIIKDISTVRYEPQRLWKWSQIALEEAENY